VPKFTSLHPVVAYLLPSDGNKKDVYAVTSLFYFLQKLLNKSHICRHYLLPYVFSGPWNAWL